MTTHLRIVPTMVKLYLHSQIRLHVAFDSLSAGTNVVSPFIKAHVRLDITAENYTEVGISALTFCSITELSSCKLITMDLPYLLPLFLGCNM
jgi:hemoglobin-like flavoprotein